MFLEAPRALVTGPEKTIRKSISAAAIPVDSAQAREKTLRAWSVLPAPRSFVNLLRAPAETTAPMMEKAIISGLMIPKAAVDRGGEGQHYKGQQLYIECISYDAAVSCVVHSGD